MTTGRAASRLLATWIRLPLRLMRARGGVAAVEFALIAPILFLVLFGIVEFGRLMWTQAALHFAVEEAARCASIDTSTCGSSSSIASYAASKVTALHIPASQFTSTTPSCGNLVSVSYPYQFVLSTLFPYAITLSANSCYPK